MRKVICLLPLISFIFACMSWIGNEWTTATGTLYLGDQVYFEIQTYPIESNQGAQVYIDWGNDGYGSTENVDYFHLPWLENVGNNSKWQRQMSLSEVGTHNRKYLGYQTSCSNQETGSLGTFTVLALNDPAFTWVVSNESNPGTQIDLQWNQDAQSHNVLIARCTDQTELNNWSPVQGTDYSDGQNPTGNIYIVWGSQGGTSGTDGTVTPLTQNTDYYYRIFSENNQYYSAGSCEDCTDHERTDTTLDNDPVMAYNYSLSTPYPNPFNPVTTISYSLEQYGQVAVNAYDIQGRVVANLVSQHQQPGSYTIQWDAQQLHSGIYFIRMNAGDFQETRKVMLLK